MVEGGASEVSEADMVAALEFGKAAVLPVIALQEAMRRELGVKTRDYDRAAAADEALREKVRGLAMPGIAAGYGITEKHDRYFALSTVKKDVIARLKESMGEAFTPQTEKLAKAVVEDLKYDHMRELTVKRRAHRRPSARRGPDHHQRGGGPPPRARLGALHPRRDPGAGGGHPRHQR